MTILRGISNKREYAARALRGMGVLRLLERAAETWRPWLLVLTYHRIAEPGADPFYDPVISATPEAFRVQVEWLRNHVCLLTPEELIAEIQTGSTWRDPAALLTFDDGYRDNFDVAVPILREQNVPATFFIPTEFLDSPRLPWWDHIAYAIKQTRVCRFTLEQSRRGGAPPLVINLEAMSRAAGIMTIVRAFLDETVTDERWFLGQLNQRTEVEVDCEGLGRGLFMTWDQVQALVDSSAHLTIGSHAHAHHKLAALDNDAQRNELNSSKRILETRLGREVTALAYPYGWPGTYTTLTKRLAAEAGYRLAFTSREGVNRPVMLDPFEVKRLGVGSGDSPTLLRARTALHAAFGTSFL
jgi:peptidoglycan/xylan/chitin deacetylase (PgdA/CDA1 family)